MTKNEVRAENASRAVQRMKKIILFILVALVLLAVNRFSTFPVLGYHAPSCLCGQCLAEFEADRVEGEQR